MGQIIFITGTDTGVGKTLLTALLLVHLRPHRHALAMKPFCSGGRNDARLLSAAQSHEIGMETLNPFHFREPLAPLVAARRAGQRIPLSLVLEKIQSLAAACELLLVEGAGGLLAPLGDRYTAIELIRALHCPVRLVVRNRLGAVNHTLLTLAALDQQDISQNHVVLMNTSRRDLATATNPELIREFSRAQVHCIPFLGRAPGHLGTLETNAKKLKKTLAQLVKIDNICPALRKTGEVKHRKLQ